MPNCVSCGKDASLDVTRQREAVPGTTFCIKCISTATPQELQNVSGWSYQVLKSRRIPTNGFKGPALEYKPSTEIRFKKPPEPKTIWERLSEND